MPAFSQNQLSKNHTQMAAKANKTLAPQKTEGKPPLSRLKVLAERKAASLHVSKKQAIGKRRETPAFEQLKAERKAAKEQAPGRKLALGLTEARRRPPVTNATRQRKKRKRLGDAPCRPAPLSKRRWSFGRVSFGHAGDWVGICLVA